MQPENQRTYCAHGFYFMEYINDVDADIFFRPGKTGTQKTRNKQAMVKFVTLFLRGFIIPA